MSKFHVRVERFIPAPAELLFEIVADPRQHPRIDGSGTVKTVDASGPTRLSLGSTFSVGMKMGANYGMVNTVVEFVEGRRIAWRPKGDYLWRYSFTPTDGGTVVVEEWDASTSKRKIFMALLGFPRRNRAGIEQTLQRLHDLALELDGKDASLTS